MGAAGSRRCLRYMERRRLFDSHCHPTDIDDPVGVIEGALRAGLHSLLACGYNAESNDRVERLQQHIPALPVAIGVHPWFADESVDGLRDQLVRCGAVAVGECGLDGNEQRPMPAREVQQRAFEHQLDLARQLALPVTVHSRQAVDSVKEITSGFAGVRGILHAFGGSYEQAKVMIDQGWLIGLGGAVTRPGARRIRKLAKLLPLSSIALETDAPAIGMEGIPGSEVRPAHLPLVVKALAALREMSPTELVAATNANVDRVFGKHVTRPLGAVHGRPVEG